MNCNSKFQSLQNQQKVFHKMKMSCKQKIGIQKCEELFNRGSQVVTKKIDGTSSEDFKNQYEPTSEIFKIEVDCQCQEKMLSKRTPQDNEFKNFKKEQQQQKQFAQEYKEQKKKPLKFVKIKNIGKQFHAFYLDLKKNSSFPKCIPINTVVLARNYDYLLWPGIITDFQIILTRNNKKIFLYKVQLIDSNKSCQLIKLYIIKFTPENIEKIKAFISNKKLYKALKIAQKMISQLFDHKNQKGLQNSQKSTQRQQFCSKVQIKLQTYLKIQPNNLIIETPKIKLQQLSLHNDCYIQSQQLSRSNENSLIQLKDKKNITNKQQTKEGSQLKEINASSQQSANNLRFLFESVLRYLIDYRNQLKNIKPRMKKKSMKKVFNLFGQPLEDFSIGFFPRYACLIDKLIQLCTEDYLNLLNKDKLFIQRFKTILSKLFTILNDYEGENGFIKGLKMLQLIKLKKFVVISEKKMKIEQQMFMP